MLQPGRRNHKSPSEQHNTANVPLSFSRANACCDCPSCARLPATHTTPKVAYHQTHRQVVRRRAFHQGGRPNKPLHTHNRTANATIRLQAKKSAELALLDTQQCCVMPTSLIEAPVNQRKTPAAPPAAWPAVVQQSRGHLPMMCGSRLLLSHRDRRMTETDN